MDGSDLGVGASFRFVGRTDEERRALLGVRIEPVWDGNQVWFILGRGAVFAAWPLLNTYMKGSTPARTTWLESHA